MTRTIFTAANLLDGEHPAKPDSTVVVEGDRIVSVGSGIVSLSPDDRIVDLGGLTVMPGMVQGHFHSTYRDVGATQAPFGLEHPPAYQAYIAADNARKALESGFTSVVGASASFDIDPSLAAATKDGLLVGPRVVAGSRDLITTSDSNDTIPWWWEAQAMGVVRTCDGPDEFRAAVRDEIKRGAEVIKLYVTGGHGVLLPRDTVSITRTELDAVVETAHARGKRVRGHVATKAAILMCIEAGVDIIDHGDGLDDECIAALVETGTFLIPSLYLPLRMLDMAGDSDVKMGFTSELGQEFRAMCDALPAAVEAGVKLCVGDDYGSAITPHGEYGPELALYVEHAGIPPLEVLRWATVNGGELVGLDGLGRVDAGAVADLVVIDGDPSVDIRVLCEPSNVAAVMRDGELLVDRLEA